MANYLEKSANFLVKEDWFGDFINKEQIEINAVVLSLSLKYNGEIGLINSVLK